MLAALSRKARVYVLNVFDVLEELPPPAGEYMAENAGERVIFDSRSKYFQKEYKAYFKEKRRRIEIFAVSSAFAAWRYGRIFPCISS